MKKIFVITTILASTLVFEDLKASAPAQEDERPLGREERASRRENPQILRKSELDMLLRKVRRQKTDLKMRLTKARGKPYSGNEAATVLERLNLHDRILISKRNVIRYGGDPKDMSQTLNIQKNRINKAKRKSFLTGLVCGGLAGYGFSFLSKNFSWTTSPADITMTPISLPSTSSEPAPLALPCPNGTESLMEGVTSTQSSFEGIDPYRLIRPQSSLLPEGLSPLSGLEGSSDPSTALIPYEAPSNFLPPQPLSGIATATPASSGPSISLTNLIPTEGQSTVIPDSNLTAVPASAGPSINLTNLIPTEGQSTVIPDSRIYGSRGLFERLARSLRTPYRWIYEPS